MLADVDKLVHGPKFKTFEINLFDGRRPHPQFMVCCDIIEIMHDFFANLNFKDHVRYKPRRLYTSPSKMERVYTDMDDSDWWWKEMVSRYWISSLVSYSPLHRRSSLSRGNEMAPLQD
jgi:hypothetical protein